METISTGAEVVARRKELLARIAQLQQEIADFRKHFGPNSKYAAELRIELEKYEGLLYGGA